MLQYLAQKFGVLKILLALFIKLNIIEQRLPVYKMFVNELIIGDNMQFMELGNNQVTYINYSIINFIMTQDAAFNNYTKKHSISFLKSLHYLVKQMKGKD